MHALLEYIFCDQINKDDQIKNQEHHERQNQWFQILVIHFVIK